MQTRMYLEQIQWKNIVDYFFSLKETLSLYQPTKQWKKKPKKNIDIIVLRLSLEILYSSKSSKHQKIYKYSVTWGSLEKFYLDLLPASDFSFLYDYTFFIHHKWNHKISCIQIEKLFNYEIFDFERYSKFWNKFLYAFRKNILFQKFCF